VDRYLRTAPLFTLVLTLGGMGGALYRLLWMLKQTNTRANDGD
jgi:F0F1-type ATP synthase assembly protein I